MKIQNTLLQAISMALLTTSCHTGAPKQGQASILHPDIPDTIQKQVKTKDSLTVRDSVEQKISAGNCPACGMG